MSTATVIASSCRASRARFLSTRSTTISSTVPVAPCCVDCPAPQDRDDVRGCTTIRHDALPVVCHLLNIWTNSPSGAALAAEVDHLGPQGAQLAQKVERLRGPPRLQSGVRPGAHDRD